MAIPTAPQANIVRPNFGVNGGRKAYAGQLSSGASGFNYASLRPKTPIITTTISAGGVPALPTAAAAQVDQAEPIGNAVVIELYQNTAQTLLPRLVAGSETSGMEIALDQVNNETVEYVVGGNHTGNPYKYVTGTSAPATFRVSLLVTTNNGIDQMVVGWRKQQTYVAATNPIFLPASDPIYTDFAGLGFAGTVASPNPVVSVTNLNNSGLSTITATGVTWASGLVHTLEVRLYGRRAFYFVNGIPLGTPVTIDGLGGAITSLSTTTPPAYTFQNALTLVPFIFIRQDAGLSTVFVHPAGTLPGLEVGPLSEIGLDPNNLQA